MPYRPIDLANTFIRDCGPLEHMKLQKLAYFVYGWWLPFKNDPLLTEGPQVWKYGPVFNSLYNVLAPYGANPVPRPLSANPFGEPSFIDNKEAQKVIKWVWDRYGGYSSVTLSDMTHSKGSPWQQVAEQHDYRVPRNLAIPDKVLKDYFQKESEKLNLPVE